MTIATDSIRGKRVANLLYNSFNTVGIHGRTDMPEDIAPRGFVRGSIEHMLFITLSVAIDYQRDADELWESSRRTYENSNTKYLFDLRSLHEARQRKVILSMQKHGLSRKLKRDAWIWRTVGVTFYKKWEGDPKLFLEDCGWDKLKS